MNTKVTISAVSIKLLDDRHALASPEQIRMFDIVIQTKTIGIMRVGRKNKDTNESLKIQVALRISASI